MIGLIHYYTHVAGDAPAIFKRFANGAEAWLPGVRVGDQRWHVPIAPDGLLEDPDELVDVLVDVGPCVVDDVGALRRLSFKIPDHSPEVRCDLELFPSRARGCRLRLRGSYRPPMATDDARRTNETIEAVVRPLVLGIAGRLAREATLPA